MHGSTRIDQRIKRVAKLISDQQVVIVFARCQFNSPTLFSFSSFPSPSPAVSFAQVEAIIFPLESLFNVQLQALDSTGSVIISTSLSSLTPHKFAVVQLHLPEGVFDIISTIQFISLMPSGHETQDFIVGKLSRDIDEQVTQNMWE